MTFAMEMKDAKKCFHEFIGERVSILGFRSVRQLEFARERGPIVAFLLFGLRKDPRGCFSGGGCVGFWFKEIDPLLEDPEPEHISVNVPFHMIAEQKFNEWNFGSNEDLQQLSSQVDHMLRQFILPFVEKFSNLGAFLKQLESESPRDWYTINPSQRVELIASIQWALGNSDQALKTIDDALTGGGGIVKNQYELKYLRHKVESLQ